MIMYRTIINYNPLDGREQNTLPSCTIPDESLSIREIFERYAQGRPLDIVQRTGYYEGDDFDDYDDLDRPDVDLVDYHERAMFEEQERARLAAERADKAKERSDANASAVSAAGNASDPIKE